MAKVTLWQKLSTVLATRKVHSMKIALLGDIAFFGRKCLAANPDFVDCLNEVASYLQTHDVVIGNLETPFVDGHSAVGAKSAHVASDKANITLLKQLGVTHVTLANNHIMDYGCDALGFTRSLLDEAGISCFGVNGEEVRLEFDGNKIAMLGYCSYNTNPNDGRCGAAGGINIMDAEVVADRLKDVRAAGYLGILAAHSGQEHVHMPGRDDITFARALAGHGEYVYYGHHPHVVQGYEHVGDAHIYYSLGNFVFDDVYTNKSPEPLIKMSEANKTGLIVSLEITDSKVVAQNCIPIYNDDYTFVLGSDIKGFSMASYSDFLALPDLEYDALRKSKIDAFISGRQAKRDLVWYFKRMRLASAFMILNARRNAKLYQLHFASKLGGLSDSEGEKS